MVGWSVRINRTRSPCIYGIHPEIDGRSHSLSPKLSWRAHADRR